MQELKKQVPRFIVAGIGAVTCDSLIYFLLIQIIDHSPAKAISFLCGTVLAYILNKHWTFEAKEKNNKELALFLLLYTCTLFINVIVNKISLNIFSPFEHVVVLAFLIATGTSTVLNFIGQKWIVFKRPA